MMMIIIIIISIIFYSLYEGFEVGGVKKFHGLRFRVVSEGLLIFFYTLEVFMIPT